VIDSPSPPPSPAVAAPAGSRARDRITALLEVVLCSSVPTQFAAATVLVSLGLPAVGDGGALSLPFVMAVSLADTVLLVALMVVLTRARGESLRELWLGSRPLAREAGLGVLLIPLVFVLVAGALVLLRLFVPSLQNPEGNPLEQLAGTPGQTAALGLVGIFAGGVREELQRAFLLRRFERHLGGPAVGVVVLSVAFGLGHFVQGWDAAIATGVIGALWAVVYLRRRSTIAPIVSHAGFNTLEVLRVAALGL